MLNPKKLTPDNADEIKPYLKYTEKHMSLAKFPTLYLWRDFTELTYDIKDGFLFMFECKFHNTAFMPFGEGDYTKAFDNLKEYCKLLSKESRLYCVGESHKEKIKKAMSGEYHFVNMRGYNEYVYLRENLANLEGGAYSKKRNHINKFMRNYGDLYEYCNISCKDREEIKRVMDIWCENKDCGPDDPATHEKNAILELLSGKTGIEFKGGAIRINGTIEAFALGGRTSDDMATVYFEKADTKYDGIYAMINKLYVENEWPDVRYINRQEDMNNRGLRKSKMSYSPEFLVKNYTVKKISPR
jgi:hypothetical protein